MPCRPLFTFLMLMAINCDNSEGQPPVQRAVPPETPTAMRPNMIGAYGPWLADQVLGAGPARLSFRTGQWTSVDAWRTAARKRVWECMAPVDLGGVPTVRVEWQGEYDGLHVERLSWQLPCGPRTEAVFLKPANAQGRLPAILGLHDHSAQKFLGWRKIARVDDKPWEVQVKLQKESYGGLPWANEIAKRGYAVLVHDTFPFASRRVRVADVPADVRKKGVDPQPADDEGVAAYNVFAGDHEHIMEKSLVSAGTTWPGVYVVEDMRALDVLCAGGRGCVAGGLRGALRRRHADGVPRRP